MNENVNSEVLWTDKKRPFFGLPISFTKYTLYKDKLYVTVKFITMHEEEIRLYRIFDITLRKSLFERIFGVGTIICHSADVSSPVLEIKNIKNPEAVRTKLSELVEKYKEEKNIMTGEYISPGMVYRR